MKKTFTLWKYGNPIYFLINSKVMRCILVLMIVTVFQVHAEYTYSQDARLSLELADVTVQNVLDEIESQSEFFFLLNKKLVDVNRKVDVSVSDLDINNTLAQIFQGEDIDYMIIDRQIVLSTPDHLSKAKLQPRTITGMVTDQDGLPILGATVSVKGTSLGTISDENGRYTLPDVPENATIVFSFVGMSTLEIAVGNQTSINVTLEVDAIGIEEVIAIGYGTVKKSDLTGAVTTIAAEDMTLGGTITDAARAIQGRVAGVVVQSNSSEPGGSISVRIRGSNSISSSNEPLYVIDGFPTSFEAGVNIEPNDIESMQILKDASATAIYGARGANGVILITTKRGRQKGANVTYSGYGGIQNLAHSFENISGKEYMNLANDLYKEFDGQENVENGAYTASQLQSNVDTDWIEETTRTGVIQNHNLQVAGGSDNSRIMVSLGYFNNTGILLNTDFSRFSGRINLDQTINDYLKIGGSVSGQQVNSQFKYYGGYGWSSNVLGPIMNYSPVVVPYNADGTFGTPPSGRGDNPLANLLGRDNRLSDQNLNSNLFLDIKPTEHLSARVMGGFATNHHFHGRYLKRSTYLGGIDDGVAHFVDASSMQKLFQTYITYDNDFGGIHSLKVMGGYSYESFSAENREMHNKGYSTDLYSSYNPGAGSTITGIDGEKYENILISFFGRLNYTLKDKYLLTFTLREDGSSRFGEDNRWGLFPSWALAWRLSQEDFIKNLDVFSNLKLRVGYGKTGNDQIGNYASYALVTTSHYTFDGTTNVAGTFMSPSNPANEALKWETTAQFNVGLDMGFFKGRLSLVMDAYYKSTTDLLVKINLPNYSGFVTGQSNVGEIENRGIELTINSRNFVKDFKWNTSLIFSHNKNEVVKISGEGDEIFFGVGIGGMGTQQYAVIREGESLGSLYGYVYDGVLQEGEVYAPQPSSKPGDPKFKDISGPDGVPDGVITSADRDIIGSAYPDFEIGFNNTFSYKGFDLSVFFIASVGNDLYNINRISREHTIDVTALDRWTPENTDTDIPRNGFGNIQYGSFANSHFVEDASFLRMKNLTFGYTIPSDWKWVETIRFYVMAEDLLTFTNYTGWNPEVNTRGYSGDATMSTRLGGGPQSGVRGNTQDANGGAGLDWNSYPAVQTFIFGVNVRF